MLVVANSPARGMVAQGKMMVVCYTQDSAHPACRLAAAFGTFSPPGLRQKRAVADRPEGNAAVAAGLRAQNRPCRPGHSYGELPPTRRKVQSRLRQK